MIMQQKPLRRSVETRQSLQDDHVTISYAAGSPTFLARFLLGVFLSGTLVRMASS